MIARNISVTVQKQAVVPRNSVPHSLSSHMSVTPLSFLSPSITGEDITLTSPRFLWGYIPEAGPKFLSCQLMGQFCWKKLNGELQVSHQLVCTQDSMVVAKLCEVQKQSWRKHMEGDCWVDIRYQQFKTKEGNHQTFRQKKALQWRGVKILKEAGAGPRCRGGQPFLTCLQWSSWQVPTGWWSRAGEGIGA